MALDAALHSVIAVTTHTSVAAQSNGDEREIRAIAIRQGETWSRHDAGAYAALFTGDCGRQRGWLMVEWPTRARKQACGWFQNTNVVPEQPFTAGPDETVARNWPR